MLVLHGHVDIFESDKMLKLIEKVLAICHSAMIFGISHSRKMSFLKMSKTAHVIPIYKNENSKHELES